MSDTLLKTVVLFGSFRFDVINQCLWYRSRRLSLRPKAFAVLRVLVERAGQLVTREELLEVVWPDTYVSDGVLRFCLRELRKTLRDKPQAPRFIETVHRRGYRFIAPVRQGQQTEKGASAPAVQFAARKGSPSGGRSQQHPGGDGPQRGGYQETIAHLARGIELLKTLPNSPERAQQELALQLALGAPLIAAKGHAAPEVEQMYARARDLCRQTGETGQLFPVLWGLTINATVRGELRLARELAEHLQSLAQNSQDPAFLLEANILYGSLLVWRGDVVSGRTYLEQALTLCDSEQYAPHAFLYGHEPAVICRVLVSEALWLLGYPEQSLRRSQEALTLAQASSHVYSLSFALNWETMFHLLRREAQHAQARAKAALAVAHEQGFAHLEAVVVTLWGGALAALGENAEGIAQIHQGLAACRATGAELVRPYLLALLAEAYTKEGLSREGLSILDEALAVGRKTGEQWYEADLYRLYGELSLRIGETETGRAGDKKNLSASPILRFSASSPEEAFLKAIEIARQQQAKSLELRAVMSLSRLWQNQGKREEARQILTAIYGWFTEGFATKDLQEARALLAKLTSM